MPPVNPETPAASSRGNVKPPCDTPSADEVRSTKLALAEVQQQSLSLLEKETTRVGKKLRASATVTQTVVDSMLADVRDARKRLENGETSVKQVRADFTYDFAGMDTYPVQVRLDTINFSLFFLKCFFSTN